MPVVFLSAFKRSIPADTYNVSFEDRGRWFDWPLGSKDFSGAALREIASSIGKCREAEESLQRTHRNGIRPYAIKILTIPEPPSGKTKYEVRLSASHEGKSGVVFHLFIAQGDEHGWYESYGWSVRPVEFYDFVERIPSILK